MAIWIIGTINALRSEAHFDITLGFKSKADQHDEF